jgi:5-methyltetrahydropteroyltriglutamate--homocysteine methyltransferase
MSLRSLSNVCKNNQASPKKKGNAMNKVNPPFRADHVGSLLRPQKLLDARDKFFTGKLPADELRAVEDEAIKEVIQKQQDVGLESITDGEFRRTYFHVDFLEKLKGVTVTGGTSVAFHTKDGTLEFSPPKLSVTGKLEHVQDIQKADYEYLSSVTKQTPKVTIPSPTMVHFRGGRKAIDLDAYPDMEEFFDDLARVYREEIQSLYAAGCRYLQMDDTNLAYLCDPQMRDAVRERGEDPDAMPRAYAELINKVVDNRPSDLRVAMHLCRGNFRSAWVAEGGYEPVAEVLFNEINIDAYFLEYDDERSGDFAPLRFVPKHKTVVLGLVTTKLDQMETAEQLKARINEASAYLPLEQMCLSPQCGFSSTVHGNQIAADTQWRKLELVVNTANEVWG